MKRIITALSVAGLLAATNIAHAQTTKQQCQQSYKQTIQACVSSLLLLDPAIRDAAMPACVHKAQGERNACETPPTCDANCETVYENQINNVCPGSCGQDAICLAVCNANAATALNSCVAACP
jgi:hypothetical protein